MERRSNRVSEAQWNILIDFLARNPTLAKSRGYNNTASGRALSARLWSEVATRLNAEGSGTTKTAKDWSIYVSNYKSKLKKLVADTKVDISGTGGGPAQTESISSIDSRFLSILGPGFGRSSPRVPVDPFPDTAQSQPSTSTAVLPPPPTRTPHSVEEADIIGDHPTSCASMAEIMSVLFFHTMRYKVSAPKDPSADRFILSKGHAAPILYAAWAEAGLFPLEELKNLRKLESDLEGHPTPRLNFVDVGTGSLGQGLAVAAGMAYVGKYFDQTPYRVYCLVGDGEAAEGSVWEALHFASHYKLDNLVIIFDVNRLGQSEPTSLQHKMEVYDDRLKAFGCHSLVVDGHDVSELAKAFDEAASVSGKPTAVVAKTYKGKGFPGIEDQDNWHGKPLGAEGDRVIKHLQSLIKNNKISLKPSAPTAEVPRVHLEDVTLSAPPAYKLGETVATRLAYGTALRKIADTNMRVIALDGDTKNSTFSDKLRAAYPERYVECFIAEQNLVGVATGAACRNRTVAFVSTFAAFFTRAFDQLRMAAISQSNINLVGSHCGVSIGEDGPSQMGLEDLALFRTLPTATVFYPSDAVAAERSVELAANTSGICYIRTSRPNTPVLYGNDEVFKVGEAKVVRQSAKDQALIVGAGITLHEALKAADSLKEAGVAVRVLDPFTVKPLDEKALLKHAKAAGGRVLVVEDHYAAGGLGEAVLASLAPERDVSGRHLYVKEVPRSGPPQALLDRYGISAPHIVRAVQDMIKV